MSLNGHHFFFRKFKCSKGLLEFLFMISSLNLVLGQIENNNSSFKFPIEENEKSSPLYIKPEESKYLKRDFLKKDPIDITDPNLNENATIDMGNQEKFLDPGDYYLSKLNGKSLEENKDPKFIVIDEFIGQASALVFCNQLIIDYLLAFVGFRVLDIFKPFPVNYFDKIKNSFGVLLDDLVAGSIIAIFFIIYYETFQ